MNAKKTWTLAALAASLGGCNASGRSPDAELQPSNCSADVARDGGQEGQAPREARDAGGSTSATTPADASTSPNANGPNANGPNANGPNASGPNASGDGSAPACPDVAERPLRLRFEELALEGADFVTDFVFVPEAGEIFATSKDGVVHHLALEGNETRLLGQFQLDVYDVLDCGLLSLALDPDFATNRFMYLGFCTDIRTSGVYRVQVSEDHSSIPETVSEVISVGGAPVAEANERPWHNVGAIDFSQDGVMWVAFGDKVRSREAENPESALGALLRIVPNREIDGAGYTPAAGNPFAQGGGHPAVWALGLRSPWRGALDHLGRYFLGDVGSDYYEEVNVVARGGQNFGWPRAEGPCEADCEGLEDPVASWSRALDHPYVLDDPTPNPINARVVNVGVEYQDRGNDRYSGRLTHRVVYGDACVGWLRALSVDPDGKLTEDVHVGHLNHVAAFRQGDDGYLYAVTYGRCQTDRKHDSDAPSRLFRAVADDP